jgi:hypothetical protein
MSHLIEGMNLEEIKEFAAGLSLACKVHETQPLVLLDYSQIDTPKNDPSGWDCRGVIYNHETKKVVCRPMSRFFNLGEQPVQQERFNWNSYTAMEKVDGSMIKVWFYEDSGEWEIATRGTMFGESNCWNTLTPEAEQISFRDLFLRTLGMSSEQWVSWAEKNLDKNFTYIFELCAMDNRVVTRYETDRIYEICAVSNFYGTNMFNLHMKEFREAGIMPIPLHPMHSRDEIQQKANELKNLTEGFVLWDGKNRIKVKSEIYVAVHHMRGESGMNPRRALDIVFKGEVDEVVVYFPEWEEYLRGWEQKWNRLMLETINAWLGNHHLETQKEFALAIKDIPAKSILFEKRKNPQTSISDLFQNTRENYKYGLMGV